MSKFDNVKIGTGKIDDEAGKSLGLIAQYPELFRSINVYKDEKWGWFVDFTGQPGNTYKIYPIGVDVIYQNKEHGVESIFMASPGNGGRALAYVSKVLGVESEIVVPMQTAKANIKALLDLGAKVKLHGNSFDEAFAEAARMANEKEGSYLVHPYDGERVIMGDAVLGRKILEAIKGMDIKRIVLPIGGGGLISGITSVLKKYRPDIKIIGVQSEKNTAMIDSISAGIMKTRKAIRSMAHSTAIGKPGEIPLEILLDGIDDVVSVSEEAIIKSIIEFNSKGKRVEGAGALPLAALLEGKISNKDGKTLLVISGANLAPEQLEEAKARV
ncbi:MAG: pyridoxal-phosphate dependent enzyme [Candidatus Gracilibacteria bacterium]|jgi:threonine dehydratase